MNYYVESFARWFVVVRPVKSSPGRWDFAYQRDDSGPKDGPSSCYLSCPPMGWANVVEKLP